jgi:hypothetical protein
MKFIDDYNDILLKEGLKDRYGYYIKVFQALDYLEIEYEDYFLPHVNDELTDVTIIDVIHEVLGESLRELGERVGIYFTFPMQPIDILNHIGIIYNIIIGDKEKLKKVIADDQSEFEKYHNLAEVMGFSTDNLDDNIVIIEDEFFSLFDLEG